MNPKSPIFKYQLGLLILGIATFALVVFLIIQGSSSRQDVKTHRAATKIAQDLNLYISSNNAIPDSLPEAYSGDVPSTIKYEKLSDEQYRFCVTYKADRKTANISNPLAQAWYGPAYNYEYTSTDYLYISDSYKKGDNCQTITPYRYNAQNSLYDDDGGFNNSAISGPYTTCGESHNYSWTMLEISSLDGDSITVVSAPLATFELDEQVKVFDKDCNPLTLGSLQVGNTVGLYFNPYGYPVKMIIKEY